MFRPLLRMGGGECGWFWGVVLVEEETLAKNLCLSRGI